MMKCLPVLTALLFCLTLSAQTPCAFDLLQQQLFENPEYAQKQQALEQQAYDFLKKQSTLAEFSGAPITIPTVVHIVHDNGPENISDAQVQQAIQWLNQALANIGPFNQGSGANTDIQLCLARRKPDETATNGITRDQSPLTVIADVLSNDAALKNLNRWAPKDYLNIWVVRSICTNSSGCGITAYAYQPIYHGGNFDGIVIEASYFGSTPGNIAPLAHELGHYFGLYHTFEGGCTNTDCLLNGDRVCDTPPDQSTAAVPCGQTVNTCTTDTQSGFSSDQPDMSWNFMDYGLYECMHDFTAGQAARMQFHLNGARKSLLASKGCLPPCPAPTVAAFVPSANTVNAGTAVVFTNLSQNFSNLEWTLNGAPFNPFPSYTFAMPGLYTVSLVAQAANPVSCSNASTTQVIRVLCPVAAGFTVSNQFPAINETVFFTNTSQQATQYEWFVNGVSQGAVLDSIAFSQAGEYEIRLMAGNGFCSDNRVLLLVVPIDQPCQGYNFIKSSRGVADIDPGQVSTSVAPDGSIYLASCYSNDNNIIQKTDALGQVIWAKDHNFLNIEFADIAATPDGGLVVLYNRIAPEAGAGIFKLNANGNMVWNNVQDLPAPTDRVLRCITPTADQGFILGGSMRRITGGQALAYFSKLDANGNQQWAHIYGPNLNSVRNILQTVDGGFIGVGGSNLWATKPIVIRLDTAGNLLWAKEGGGSEGYNTVLPTADGNYMIASSRYPWGSTSGWRCDSRLTKISPEGNVLWEKLYGVNFTGKSLCFSGITRGNFGGYRIVGHLFTSIFDSISHTVVLQLDESGNILNNQVFNSLQKPGMVFTDIQRMASGYAISGYLQNDIGIVLAKMDEAGNMGNCTADKIVFTSTEPSKSLSTVVPQVFDVQAWSTSTIEIFDLNLFDTLHCDYRCDTLVFQPEICSNNIDDDGDGLFDCLDPDCDCPDDACKPKQADIWYFGKNSGLDFSTDPPTVLTDGKTDAQFASAVANDAQGKLLFYSDGKFVYNRFHQAMPNGQLLPSGPFIDAESMILQHPGKPSVFYLFTNSTNPVSGSSFNYSVIDMQLDNGRGDILPGQKSISLFGPEFSFLSRIAAVQRCGLNGHWLLVKALAPAPVFYAFRIDANGFNTTPVPSASPFVGSIYGQMKFSPDGLLLAETNYLPRTVNIYEFDGNTGIVSPSYKYQATLPYSPFGLEFSPNGRFLYVSIWDEAPMTFHSEIIQLDLQGSGGPDISATGVQVASLLATIGVGYSLFSAMQLGPDGKIYISSSGTVNQAKPNLQIIHRPNRPGAACQFQADALSLAPSAGVYAGFCNFPANLFVAPRIAFPANAPDTICTLNEPVFYQIPALPCYADSIVWTLEGIAGTLQSNFQFASVTYTAAGQGRLIVQVFTECGLAADTLHIVAEDLKTPVLDLGPDRLVCDNGVFTFQAAPAFERYRWQDGSSDSTFTTLFPGKYWVDVWDRCGAHQSDTIAVSIAPATVLDLGPDLEHCPGLTTTFSRPAIFSHWQWLPASADLSCDTCASVTVTAWTSTSYQILAQTAEGCISLDTLNFQINDTIFRTLDTIACANASLTVFGLELPADTTAQIVLPASSPGQCDTLWTVHVFGEPTSSSTLDTVICPESLFEYQGVFLKPGSQTEFTFSGSNGCDSFVNVRVMALPTLSVSLPADTTLGLGASLTLSTAVAGAGPFSYTWTPATALSCSDCPEPVAAPLSSTSYTLQVSDGNGCQQADSILISIDTTCRWLPVNAFTPDGDGYNDWFFPNTSPCVTLVRSFQIFNRWGQVVFERRNFPPNQENLGWDGQNSPTDVYIWLAELEYFDGKTAVLKGELSLLR